MPGWFACGCCLLDGWLRLPSDTAHERLGHATYTHLLPVLLPTLILITRHRACRPT